MSKSPRYMQYPESPIENYGYRSNRRYDEIHDVYDDDDICEVCEISTPHYNCNKCARSICGEGECCITFPHHKNTTYFVCMSCTNEISIKLILQIDLGKLVLLKEKIRSGTTCNSVCSSRTTSLSSCSTNMNSIGTLSDDGGYSLSNSDCWRSSLTSCGERSDSITSSNSSD
jgi:hypothetical protein